MIAKFTLVGFFPPIAISVVSQTLGLSPFKNKNQIETDFEQTLVLCNNSLNILNCKNCERTHSFYQSHENDEYLSDFSQCQSYWTKIY